MAAIHRRVLRVAPADTAGRNGYPAIGSDIAATSGGSCRYVADGVGGDRRLSGWCGETFL